MKPNWILFYFCSTDHCSALNKIILFFYTVKDTTWPALSGLRMIHICPCISSFFIHYGYFSSIHIVQFRTIGGCIDYAAIPRVLKMLSEDKKKKNVSEKYHWALNERPWVLRSRCYDWKRLQCKKFAPEGSYGEFSWRTCT